MNITKNRLWTLFITFFKIGLFTFGGGYAMIPLIQSEITEKHKWMKAEEIFEIIVIAESTPGPIAINSATYVGYKVGGVIGAFVATLGVVLPSFGILFLISLFLNDFLALTVVANAFKGIKIAVAILIVSAAIKLSKKMPKSWFTISIAVIIIMIELVLEYFGISFSTIYFIVFGAIFGLVSRFLSKDSEVTVQ
ncbi:MAG: chromate transporter [Methanomicrobia archaeon]|nr:chromate transporter [Methanomicrobia archaeon]